MAQLKPDIEAALEAAHQALESAAPDMLASIEQQMAVINALVPDHATSIITRDVVRLATAMCLRSDTTSAAAQRLYAYDALDRLRFRLERRPTAYAMLALKIQEPVIRRHQKSRV